jgi:stage II sporulation protein P
VNESSDSYGELYSVTGYAGGSYIGVSGNTTPTDIEALKEQAEKLFENYTKAGNIKETHMGATSKTLTYGVVELDNKTNQTVSLKKLLNDIPSYGEITKEEPYILIYHTHSTEGYEMLDLGWYAKEYNSRTKDTSKNMVRVGDELTRVLEEAGYNVIHDRNIYDESYNGAYARSRVSVDEYLEKYPSIQITLDVHRDAIYYSDTSHCKPTAEIDGKKAAQIMIITGAEEGYITDFPFWEDNLKFALTFQKTAEESFPGLMKPLYFCQRKYNMDTAKCSLLLEIGTDANTLEEALYSAHLTGKILTEIINESMG